MLAFDHHRMNGLFRERAQLSEALRQAEIAASSLTLEHNRLISAPDGDVAEWAVNEFGLANLVRSVRIQFSEKSVFMCTAAVMEGTGIHPSVAALLRWMLAEEGVTLPAGSS
jgi:hypothetical protein